MANPYARLAELPDEEDEKPSSGKRAASFSRLANLDDGEAAVPAAKDSPSAAPVEGRPWWSMPTGAELGRQAALTGRAIVQGVAGLPAMAMDAGVAARNLTESAVNRFAPSVAEGVYNLNRKLAGSSDIAAAVLPGGPNVAPYVMPSAEFSRALTDVGVPEPKTAGEKVAGFLQSMAVGSRLPSPRLEGPPEGFVRPPANESGQILRDAQAAGYVVPPTTAKPNLVNKLAEGFAGKAAAAQAASAKNQEVTNELVRRALQLKNGEPITPAVLKDLRSTAGKVYEQIADGGDIRVDDQFLSDLAQLGRGADEVTAAFPGANVGAGKQIGELVESMLQENFSSKAALQYLRELRKHASANLSGINAADPSKQALGMAQREAASTLEDLIGRHLTLNGQADLAQSFGQARRVIAMSHSVENALNETTGNVIAGKLTQQLSRGKPLSGELETVARFGQAFPKAAKEITESMPGVSPLDWALAIGGSVATSHVGPMAGVLARPSVRAALLSPWWQQQLDDAAPYVAPQTLGIAPSAALQAGQ